MLFSIRISRGAIVRDWVPQVLHSTARDVIRQLPESWHAQSGEDDDEHLAHIELAAKRARAMLIEANLRLVVSVAEKLRAARMPLLDLIQEGNVGLSGPSKSSTTAARAGQPPRAIRRRDRRPAVRKANRSSSICASCATL
jgi:hypothetical protein